MEVGDAYVFPGFLTPVLTQFFFPKPPTTFLTCFCRGERQNTSEGKAASTRDRTHNHQVMSPTRSPLSHPDGAVYGEEEILKKSSSQKLFVRFWNNSQESGFDISRCPDYPIWAVIATGKLPSPFVSSLGK